MSHQLGLMGWQQDRRLPCPWPVGAQVWINGRLFTVISDRRAEASAPWRGATLTVCGICGGRLQGAPWKRITTTWSYPAADHLEDMWDFWGAGGVEGPVQNPNLLGWTGWDTTVGHAKCMGVDLST